MLKSAAHHDPEERAQLSDFCEIIATEKDPDKFESAVNELLVLVQRKRERFHSERNFRTHN